MAGPCDGAKAWALYLQRPSQSPSPRGLLRGSCCTCIIAHCPSASPAPSLLSLLPQGPPFQSLFLGNPDHHRPIASDQLFPSCPVKQNAFSIFPPLSFDRSKRPFLRSFFFPCNSREMHRTLKKKDSFHVPSFLPGKIPPCILAQPYFVSSDRRMC